MEKKGGVEEETIISIALVLVLAVIFLYEPILTGLGRFMAPRGGSQADEVVVEGEQVVREGAVRAGVALIKESRAKKKFGDSVLGRDWEGGGRSEG